MTRLVCLALLLAVATAAHAEGVKAGAFAQDVTPTKFPISVNGNMADIQAKAASASNLPQLRLMMRALLADRFQLAMHSAQKEMAVYELVLGKNWRKPAESQANLPPRLSIANGNFVFQHASMPWFAEKLSDFAGMDRPVVDRTGVTGDFDFTLKTAATVVLQRDIDALFSIVQEQLFLRIVPRRNTVEVWVVDRVERPTAN